MENRYNNTIDYWYTGRELRNFIENSEEAGKKKKRFCYKPLMGFLLNRGKDICALYGIRRTGKTVLMLQAIRDLMENYHVKPEVIAYITIADGSDMDDQKLLKAIESLGDGGVKYVFVDEISYVQMDLDCNCLNILADRLAKSGMKIVIAGTFSYAIRLLGKNVLFDRMQQIDTTYISMKEAFEVFGMDIDEFIQYGGIINLDGNEEDQKKTPAEYMEAAIVQNIVRSIFKSERKYDLLETIPDTVKKGKTEEQLRALIASLVRISIDNYMRILVVGKLANKLMHRYSDVAKLANIIRSRSEKESVLDENLEIINIDKQHYYEILAKYLGNSEQVPNETFREIVKILEDIQIKQDIILEDGIVSVFIPNYLRYGLCDEIMKTIGELVREETNQRYDAGLAGEILKGSIQEAVCYLDLKKAGSYDFDMYRTADGSCEVDLIIKNHERKTLRLYEIKHSSQVVPEQAKHLLNQEFVREIEHELGYKAAGYYILYNGENTKQVYDPKEVFESLKDENLNLNKIQNVERWERLVERAEIEAWEPLEIGYINMTEFLCGLAIVK